MLKFEPGISVEEMYHEMTGLLLNSPIIPGLFTFFHFEGSVEIKTFTLLYVDKLAEMVHRNLEVLADRDWNAVMHIEAGLIHVFFGKNNGTLEIPRLFLDGVQGSC